MPAGRKQLCWCEICAICKSRVRNRRHQAKKKAENKDPLKVTLESKIVQYFKDRGWD